MDLKGIAAKAKQVIDKRGGTGALKEDATELKDVATGSGSLTDKAKGAVEAIKDPGAEGAEQPQRPAGSPERRGKARGGARRGR
jgi:hypothetical protein